MSLESHHLDIFVSHSFCASFKVSKHWSTNWFNLAAPFSVNKHFINLVNLNLSLTRDLMILNNIICKLKKTTESAVEVTDIDHILDFCCALSSKKVTLKRHYLHLRALTLSAGSWCNHACFTALGSGCVWASVQPVHGRAAVGAVPWHPYGVQAGDGGPAVLLGHRLWQQHLPECARFWPAGSLPGGHLWKPGKCQRAIGISVI